MNKTNFFFISTGYIGGASKFIYDHLSYLNKKNKEITLIDDDPYKTFPVIPKQIKIKKIKINKYYNVSYQNLKRLILKDNSKKIIFLTNYAFVIRYFFLIQKIKKKKNIKLILTIHSGLLGLNIKKYFSGFIFSLIYKKIDFLYFGSVSAKKWWLKYFPWMKIKKNLIQYNGVQIQNKLKFKKRKKILSVSFIGRLEKENNPEFFIEIAKHYLKLNKNSIFNIYGIGSMYNYLKKNFNSHNIKVHGWRNKYEMYNNSDIILITGPVNNFPYVALEAKSFGLPVISCSHGDIKKIIKNGVDGYIIYTNSSKKIIRLIDRISINYEMFSYNSIKRSKLFDINVACKKFWKNFI